MNTGFSPEDADTDFSPQEKKEAGDLVGWGGGCDSPGPSHGMGGGG